LATFIGTDNIVYSYFAGLLMQSCKNLFCMWSESRFDLPFHFIMWMLLLL